MTRNFLISKNIQEQKEKQPTLIICSIHTYFFIYGVQCHCLEIQFVLDYNF